MQYEACGLVMDRDLNAAKNLAALAAQGHHVAESGPETQNASRRDVRPDTVGQTLMKREASPSLMGWHRRSVRNGGLKQLNRFQATVSAQGPRWVLSIMQRGIRLHSARLPLGVGMGQAAPTRRARRGTPPRA